MSHFNKIVVPGDTSTLPGMKTLMADRMEKGKVIYVPNVPYVNRAEETLHLQLLLPDGLFPSQTNGRRYPLVVYVQGAAWGEQDVFHNFPQLFRVASAGFVIASVKHRASSVVRFPGFLEDVKSAIRFLRAKADMYSIDPDAVAIWGDSSGGNAALLTGVTGDMPQFKTNDNAELSDAVSAVVDFYGPTDLSKINDAPRNPALLADMNAIPEDILFGGSVMDHPEICKPGNPIDYVTAEKDLPPFLIMHGDSDGMVPFHQSFLMAQKLQECGKTVEFYKVCGADHGFFMWTTEVLDTVIQFLKAYIAV